MSQSYQIWAILTERGPLQAKNCIDTDDIEAAITKANAALDDSDWFGVGVKLVGSSAWEWVDYRETPLFDKTKKRGGAKRKGPFCPLPMKGNPAAERKKA
jgi:hypothetical protein